MPQPGTAAVRWRRDLAAWAIPEPILAAAPEDPYRFPSELFRRRAARASAGVDPPTPTTERALEALPEGGTVLDVGCGSGATSLPLVGHVATITGVDESARMLAAFSSAAAEAGVASATVEGRWPDMAADVDVADVVCSGHVLYNVPELGPFALALDGHARRRVVVELTERHPWAWMGDLWIRFHDLERPAIHDSDSRRIISTVFEPFEAFQKHIRRLSVSAVTDDSAHVISSVQ